MPQGNNHPAILPFSDYPCPPSSNTSLPLLQLSTLPICKAIKSRSKNVSFQSWKEHNTLRILTPFLMSLFFAKSSFWHQRSLILFHNLQFHTISMASVLSLSISANKFLSSSCFFHITHPNVFLTVCLPITSHTFIICLWVKSLTDDASVLEFRCVWDYFYHQTSHALETLESTVTWSRGDPFSRAALKEGTSQGQFPLAEILRWISQGIKKLKPIKGQGKRETILI